MVGAISTVALGAAVGGGVYLGRATAPRAPPASGALLPSDPDEARDVVQQADIEQLRIGLRLVEDELDRRGEDERGQQPASAPPPDTSQALRAGLLSFITAWASPANDQSAQIMQDIGKLAPDDGYTYPLISSYLITRPQLVRNKLNGANPQFGATGQCFNFNRNFRED